MGTCLHKFFKAVINELKNALNTLGESGSKVSHFITEPRNFEEVTRLPSDFKKYWLKATSKNIQNLINNQTFLMDDLEKGYLVTPCMDIYKAKIQYDGSIDKLKFDKCSQMRLAG